MADYELRAKSPVAATVLDPARPGETLRSHLIRTALAAMRIRDRVGRIAMASDEFWTWVICAALLHDAGKIAVGFQQMIGNTSLPARVWGQRHEVLSLGFVGHVIEPRAGNELLWIAAAVAGHHRPFTDFGGTPSRPPIFTEYGADGADEFSDRFTPVDPIQFADLLDWLARMGRRLDLPLLPAAPSVSIDELTTRAQQVLHELMDRYEKPQPPDAGLLAVLLLGAVTMSDHLSSGQATLLNRHPLPSDYRAVLVSRLAKTNHALLPQQEKAADIRGHLLLRSWTASGKTEAALLWARTQIDDVQAATPRVFYVLPYLASINAMATRLATELGAADTIGIAHSRAASYHLARALAEGCDGPDDLVSAAQRAHSRAEATRNFRELIRIGTPYQLLRAALAGPVYSSILVDSANSVFVLDELHAYDSRRLGFVLAMMGLWNKIGGRIAVLSATLPSALVHLVREALGGDVPLVEPAAGAKSPARHRIEIRDEHLTAAESRVEIIARIRANQSVLVVANNVKDAVELYESLAPECLAIHGDGSAFLLHSRFKRGDRDRIEHALMDRFAAGSPRRPGLLVGTQALEVSLNIDLDCCHTSAADLEALLQRFGRANRIGALAPVPVIVHQPRYATRGNSADEWADGVYAAQPTRSAWEILNRHVGEVVDEAMATEWLDEIYRSPWGAGWREEVEFHRTEFHDAFLEFEYPFDDRSILADRFDQLFDGTEAVLVEDLAAFEDALHSISSDVRSARLHAEQLLIPLPHWVKGLTRFDRKLRVQVIDGEYCVDRGLLSVRGPAQHVYRPGEIL